MKTRTVVAVSALFTIALLVIVAAALNRDRDTSTVTVTVGGPHNTPEREIEVPEEAVAEAAESELGDHEGARSELPPGVPTEHLDAAREQQERLAETDQLPIVTPLAAPEQRGCTTRLVQNFSSRRGVRPRLIVLHYTVSPNRPGWSDVNAIVSLFDRPSFQASSNYVTDSEGNCAYIVRESDKAWTQAAANPVSISIEQINTGREQTYAATAGLAKIGLVVHDAARRWEIPLQQGLMVNCTIVKPGLVDHRSLGPCGGGHVDVSPYPAVAQVLAAARKLLTPTKPAVTFRWICDTRIRSVQAALNRRAGTRLTVDGMPGPATRAAVLAYQRRNGLPASGVAGRGTALKLGLCRRVARGK